MSLVGKADKPADWHAERMLGIGGSEAAAAVGLSPWLDPIDLWAIKRGEMAEKEPTFRMRLGNLIEPVIGVLYSEATGRALRHHERQFVHPSVPWLRDHPDFSVVGERRLVQAKNAGAFAEEWGEPGAPEAIPVHYRVQGYHELAATGYQIVDFAVLREDGLGIYPLERDEAVISDLLVEEGDFWQHVVDGTMPSVSKASGSALGRRFPKPDGEVKVASAEQEAQIAEYLATRKLRALAEERETLAENIVKGMIGDAQAIEGAGSRVSWGLVRGSVAWKPVAASLYAALVAEEHDDAAGRSLEEFAEFHRGASYRKISVAKLGKG